MTQYEIFMAQAAPTVAQVRNPNAAAAAAAAEIKRETVYRAVALVFDINQLMPVGVTFNKFTARYAKFAGDHPTPDMLIEAEDHAKDFIAFGGYEGDVAEGAAIWAISRVWLQKRDAGVVFTPGLLAEILEVQRAKDQRTELHIAVAKLAKYAPEDSFAAGLKVRVTDVLNVTGRTQLAALTAKAEVQQ